MPYNLKAFEEGEVLSSFKNYLFVQNAQTAALICANFEIVAALLCEHGAKRRDDPKHHPPMPKTRSFCKRIWWTTPFDCTGIQSGLHIQIRILPIGDDSTAIYMCHRIVHPLLPLFRNRLYLIESVLVNYLVSIKQRAEVIEGMAD
ncbi:MAG: hypothetical protein ACKVOK_11965 [Flavobacteriales bacterium]